MRRIYYGLGVIAVVAFGLVRCWQGGAQGSKQPQAAPGAAASASEAEVPSSSPAAEKTAPSAASSAGAADEEPLVRRLHKLEGTNPDLAVSLALEDRQRNPKSPDAEERDMVLVAAYYNGRNIQAAKREAWYYFIHYPGGRFTDYLSKLTRIEPPKTRPPE